MREEKVREVVTRMLTDTDFLKSVQETPRRALHHYDLTNDELAAISSSDTMGLGIGRLETRISAAAAFFMGGDPDLNCGCKKVPPPVGC